MHKPRMLRSVHTIAVDDQNYEALRNLGRTADTFNDVIARLVKKAAEGDTVSSHKGHSKLAFEESEITPHKVSASRG